ncbi:hypothetical protein BBJ28_00025077 [Nothophytophthora sp. Chile5]|nr:hypothetical protein BBJ28_00025077 [Nothophytophthora sp. Chile5]
MVVVALTCILWTTWLLFLTLAPNEAANYLMGTTAYDDGSFWLILESPPAIKVSSALGLVIVDLGYLFVLFKMLFWRTRYPHCPSLTSISRTHRKAAVNSDHHSLHRRWTKLVAVWRDLTGINGRRRKFWNLALKIGDLTMQSMTLNQLLDGGFPLPVVYGYAAFVAINSLTFGLALFTSKHSALTEILLDSVFDLLAAVLYPIIILAYCYKKFDFDRKLFQIYTETFPIGSYERGARTLANPSEIALFRASFDALRIRTPEDLLLRISMNLSFCYRFKRIVEVLFQQHRRAVQHCQPTNFVAVHQERVPRGVTWLFLAFSALVIAHTHLSITTSHTMCSAYPQCVVYAYRWQDTSEASCPCLTLIHGDEAPRTYDQWVNPEDATPFVEALATAGMLQTLQLVNLELSLIYTSTRTLPSWMKEFRQLEYLFIGGKHGTENLVSLPDDLLSDMPVLTYLHFGAHLLLEKLPPLDGVPSLRSLALAVMFSLVELPSLEHLVFLERLEIVMLPALRSLPDLASVESKLTSFVVKGNCQICCNGFLGTCDLSDSYCSGEYFGSTRAECVGGEPQAAPSTLEVISRFIDSVCFKIPMDSASVIDEIPVRENVEVCGGVRFRQCVSPWSSPPPPNSSGSGSSTNATAAAGASISPGICYNTRMQVLTCTRDPLKIELRKREIQENVGPVCDPVEEAWLGCVAQPESP